MASTISASFTAIAALSVATAVSIVWPASAQQAAPAVGVVEVVKRPLTERSEFLGRIEAVERVNVVARLNAFLDKRLFKEGDEVKANDLLYRLQRGPFEADLQARKAQVAQLEAMLANARITTDRQQTLLKSPAGLQSSYDSAIANQKSLEAQLQAAEAQVSLSEINLGYADIRSPIDGKIDRTSVTEGNVVGPGSGTLTTIVSQDPMYVTFPVSVREMLALRERYIGRGLRNALTIRVKLPDGRLYGEAGRVDFASNSITRTTDTLLVRGTIPNPRLNSGPQPVRELTDGELVTVLLEGTHPVEVLAIPRSAVLADQQGSYVLLVGADNKVEQRRIQTGQSTTTVASIASGLSLGDKVIAEGLQYAKPGQVVAPAPASAAVQATLKQELTGPAPAARAIPASSTQGLNR